MKTAAAGFLSVAVNTLLFAAKLFAGISTGSIAIIADAWHTLSDSLSSVVVIVGALVAKKPQDDEHPFGHERAEWIAAIIIAVLLAVIGVNFAIEAVSRLSSPTGHVVYGRLAIAVLIASVVAKELLAQVCFYSARKNGSQALKADAWHHRSDALSSLLILAGVLFGQRFIWMDAVLGLAVSVMILLTAFSIMRQVGSMVLGESPGSQFVKDLQRIANQVVGKDVDLHHVHKHSYGDHCEVTMHIRLDNGMSVAEAHELVDLIEEQMRQQLGIEPTIHVEPWR